MSAHKITATFDQAKYKAITATAHKARNTHYLTDEFTVVGVVNGKEVVTLATVRCYRSSHNARKTTAWLWVWNTTGLPLVGAGCGECVSSAISAALRNSGIELSQDIEGACVGTLEAAVLAASRIGYGTAPLGLNPESYTVIHAHN